MLKEVGLIDENEPGPDCSALETIEDLDNS